MKKIIVLIFFLITLKSIYSQDFQWAKSFGGSMPDNAQSVYIDNLSNIYITGGFRSKPAIFGNDSIFASGFGDIFLLKTEQLGNSLWVKKAGGIDINGVDVGKSIALDISNNIYLAGQFFNNANFDSSLIVGYGDEDGFVAKYSENGTITWVKKMGGITGDGAIGVCVDNNQNIFVCGGFNSSIAHFDTINIYASYDPIKYKIFISKYSALGNVLWVVHSTSGSGYPLKIISKNSKIYVTGYFQDTLSINGNTLIGTTKSEIFLGSLKTDGEVNWLKSVSGSGWDASNSIFIDNVGDLYLTGYFSDTAYFGTLHIIAPSSQGDMFIAKYDSLGNFIWVKQLNCSGAAEGKNIISDGQSGFYVTGSFSGIASFGSYVVSALSTQDMFIAHYDSAGNCLGVRQAANAIGYDIAIDNSGNCIITGTFTGNTSFDGFNLVSKGSTDIFLAKTDPISGISEVGKTAIYNLIIYANPTTGKCNITIPDDFLNEKNLTLTIFDNNSKLIQQQKLEMSEGKVKINLEQEAKGVYNVILSNGKKNYSGKIVFE